MADIGKRKHGQILAVSLDVTVMPTGSLGPTYPIELLFISKHIISLSSCLQPNEFSMAWLGEILACSSPGNTCWLAHSHSGVLRQCRAAGWHGVSSRAL